MNTETKIRRALELATELRALLGDLGSEQEADVHAIIETLESWSDEGPADASEWGDEEAEGDEGPADESEWGDEE